MSIMKTNKMVDSESTQETNDGDRKLITCYHKVLELDNANSEEDVYKDCCIRGNYLSGNFIPQVKTECQDCTYNLKDFLEMILRKSGMPDISNIICTGCMEIKPLLDHNPATECTNCGVPAKTSLARVMSVIGAGLCLPTEKDMTMIATAEDSTEYLRECLNDVLSSLISLSMEINLSLEAGKKGTDTPCKLMAYINSIGADEKNLLLPYNNSHLVCEDWECLDLGIENAVRVKLLDNSSEIAISELHITKKKNFTSLLQPQSRQPALE